MNNSEKLVYYLCKRTFLSLWSIPNPSSIDPNKELCDILVICDPDVMIISVKEIKYKPTKDIITGWNRWRSKAIEKSADQIFGAERALSSMKEVKCYDSEISLPIPEKNHIHIHRIAVALGGKDEVPMAGAIVEKGYIHIFDERMVNIILRELNTITDFVQYLDAVETFVTKQNVKITTFGGENLLAWYLQNGRRFPNNVTDVLLADDMWNNFFKSEKYRAKKEADKESYMWDGIIEFLIESHDPYLSIQYNTSVKKDLIIEKAIRVMAMENRFARRFLSKAFKDFHIVGDLRSRIVSSPSGITYVFLAAPRNCDREERKAELMTRCFVARGKIRTSKTVVGIATETYKKDSGFSFDVMLYQKDNWTKKDEDKLQEIQKKFGTFVDPKLKYASEDEYPTSNEEKSNQ